MMNHKKIIAVIVVIATLIATGLISIFVSASGTNSTNPVFGSNTVTAADSNLDLITTYKYEDIISIKDVKQNIFNNMLNSVDFYNYAEGEFSTTFLEGATVTYKVDILGQIAYQKVLGSTMDLENDYIDGSFVSINNTKKSYSKDRYSCQEDLSARTKLNENIFIPQANNFKYFDGEKYLTNRVGIAPDGKNAYYYRSDITNASYAATSIFSQDLVFGFLSDFNNWNVTGVESYLDRQAVVLSGKIADGTYSSKLNVTTFEMKVDSNTGILLDFKGYSKDGKLSQDLTTKKLFVASFNSKADLKSFVESSINEKTALTECS